MLLDDEIQKLKNELDNSISNNDSFDKIYQISLKLDVLIAEYYKQKQAN